MTALRLHVAGDAAAVGRAQAELAGFLRAAGLSPRLIGHAELLFEEAVLNSLRHGFPAGLPGAVDVLAETLPGGCRLVFEDAGRPFDPTALPAPAAPQGLGQARIGGLGLPLLRRLSHGLRYERLPEGRNRLSLSLGE